MKNKQQQLQTRLSIFFWANIISVIVILLAILYFKGPDFGTSVESDPVIEQYAIILTLVSIPLALKLYHVQYKKIKMLGEDIFLSKIPAIFTLRIVILDIAIFLNMLAFYLFESKNFIYMTVITIFALVFCFPAKNMLYIENEEVKNNNDIKD